MTCSVRAVTPPTTRWEHVMYTPTTLVTAAAGKTGRQTALSLLDRGLAVRAAELRSRGAEVVVGNVSDVADVRRALRGVQRAYWTAPIGPGALEAATLFAAIA